MSPDTEQPLRTVPCRANPSGMQAARWRDACPTPILNVLIFLFPHFPRPNLSLGSRPW
ncbi:hypothetical protein BN940_10556 [Castellaniella defragrans 65Phen]|uniref:Uncharacterized protein n=1 Tax=Castellaniella defragrans (strain DSM 12143 / CCUG 39792 / 65Phen) TaxID=1437824 RepID=W8X4S5_CASD6|nr:hypothetical protein BN940_10556 [Castellaniella defragrans 65Phen]